MTRRTSADVQGRPQTPADVHVPHPPPANDPPAWRTMASVAEELKLPSTRAARDWCRSRGVPYKRDGKYLWVDYNDVRAAIARAATYTPPPKAPPPPTLASWVDSTLGGKRG